MFDSTMMEYIIIFIKNAKNEKDDLTSSCVVVQLGPSKRMI